MKKMRIRNSRSPEPTRPWAAIGTIAAVWLLCFGCTTVRGEEGDGQGAALRGTLSGMERGATIYAEKCAHCHGGRGEGTADYEHPLIGDRSILELAKVIDETMPEDDPSLCVAEDAAAVAAYIHHHFYSPEAQVRNAPPRVDVARLTVDQFRQSVIDLYAAFRGDAEPWSDQRGLHATYFDNGPKEGNDFGGDGGNHQKEFTRIDPSIAFAWGETSPIPESIDPKHRWSVVWNGSILAPETGMYEFFIKTKNGIQLWVNDEELPLIDAQVRSGTDPEYQQSIVLVGGRSYHIQFQLTKDEETQSAIELDWQRPGQQRQPIPTRYLSPTHSNERMIVASNFPPDDSSTGYERGASISKAWYDAITSASIDVAAMTTIELDKLAGSQPEWLDRDQYAKTFAAKFVERAFRRPLSDQERATYVDGHFIEGRSPEESTKRVVLLTLQSPRFLYPDATTAPDAYTVASRLALAMWDSLPDDELIQAAHSGQLLSADHVREQAHRMLADPRAHMKLRRFLHHWLNVHRMRDMSKDPERFPEFGDPIVGDLRESLDLFLDEVAWNGNGDFRQMLLADYLFLNDRLANLYGYPVPDGGAFAKVGIDARQRAGVLSHPYLMTGFAYNSSSSPIHRGVFLVRHVLGRQLKPPAEAITPLSESAQPDLSTRDRVSLQTKGAACQSCHAIINPLGFSLEQYDAIGRFRAEEKGKAVDATGFYLTKDGEEVRFDGVRQLAEFLANSPEVHAAFVRQMFHDMIKQPIPAYGPDAQQNLTQRFTESQFSIQQLMVDIATSATLHQVPQPSTP
jgi:mono/diheme cytochrome c family protein